MTIITLSKYRLYESLSLFRVLSPSFIFWCKTITKISAYFKCIVSCCCSCKKWNLETIPWIVKNKLYADDSDNHYVGAIRIPYYVNLWSASTNLRFRPRPHESWYFWNRIFFLHESAIRPQETSKSAVCRLECRFLSVQSRTNFSLTCIRKHFSAFSSHQREQL